ncbi:zinc finger protein 579 [Hemicordylus capensis]|uniref:zinc finger protein 579 n=1 Tax=Hemicordylus capensis TaxID=884348 RepID=UPI0023038A87|nr:zinc finger protein 579 [Hemicordylus capensis]
MEDTCSFSYCLVAFSRAPSCSGCRLAKCAERQDCNFRHSRSKLFWCNLGAFVHAPWRQQGVQPCCPGWGAGVSRGWMRFRRTTSLAPPTAPTLADHARSSPSRASPSGGRWRLRMIQGSLMDSPETAELPQAEFLTEEKPHPKPSWPETGPHPSYPCPSCHKPFFSEAALQGHRCQVGSKSRKACHICGKEFKFSYYLARHCLTHSGQKRSRCPLCWKTFGRPAHLAHHKCACAVKLGRARECSGSRRVSPHLQEPGKFLQCRQALSGKTVARTGGKDAVASATIASEKQVLLQEDWTLLCLACGEAFETKGELKAHRCFKGVASQDDGERQEGTKRHQCGICHKLFARPWSLSRHYLVHTGEKPFSCPECGMAFHLSSYLRQHHRMHVVGGACPLLGQARAQGAAFPLLAASPSPPPPAKKAYECSVCQKPFKSKYDLATHSLIHTGALPFQCSQCGKRFRRLSHLKQHGVTHTAARPFQCVMCQKEFKRLADLARHRQVHEGDKPHQCGICHKCFSRSYSLLRHQRCHLPEVAALPQPEDYLSNSCFDSQDHSAFLTHQEEGEEGKGNATEVSSGV